jgi:hypothetical protein
MVRKILFVFAAFAGFCGVAAADSVTPPAVQNYSAWVAEPGEDPLPAVSLAEPKFSDRLVPYMEPAEAAPHYKFSGCSRGEPKEEVYLTQ